MAEKTSFLKILPVLQGSETLKYIAEHSQQAASLHSVSTATHSALQLARPRQKIRIQFTNLPDAQPARSQEQTRLLDHYMPILIQNYIVTSITFDGDRSRTDESPSADKERIEYDAMLYGHVIDRVCFHARQCTQLTEFRVNQHIFNTASFYHLRGLLRDNTSLAELKITNSSMFNGTPQENNVLAAATNCFASANRLRILRLNNVLHFNKWQSSFVRGLRSCINLEVLDISRNNLSGCYIHHLTDEMILMPKLHTLLAREIIINLPTLGLIVFSFDDNLYLKTVVITAINTVDLFHLLNIRRHWLREDSSGVPAQRLHLLICHFDGDFHQGVTI